MAKEATATGLHVADLCSRTGQVRKQHVSAHAVRITLNTTHDKVFKRHRLVLYLSGCAHPLLLCTTTKPMVPGVPRTVTLHTTTTESPACLCVRWYACRYDPLDGLEAQELVATGTGTDQIALLDISGAQVGTLRVELPSTFVFSSSSSSSSSSPPSTPRGNKMSEELIGRVLVAQFTLATYRPATDNVASFWMELDTRVLLPVLWYPLHAAQIQCVDPRAAIQLLEHWCRIATRMCAQEAKQTGRDSSYSTEERLVALLTLPSLAWVYRPDRLVDGTVTDHWCSLWSQPTGERQAFDCEDGTKAILEVFHVLVRLRLNASNASPSLRALQACARRYRAWMAIGELRSEDGSARLGKKEKKDNFITHCYLMLLPMEGKEKSPPLTIESTAHASGVWTSREAFARTLAKDRAFCQTQEDAIDQWSAHAQENARVRIPTSVVCADGMYGQLMALMSVQDGFPAEHRLMNRVDTASFLLGGGGGGAVEGERVPIRMPVETLRASMQRELSFAPPSVFPSLAEEREEEDEDSSSSSLDMFTLVAPKTLSAGQENGPRVFLSEGLWLERVRIAVTPPPNA